MRKRNREEGLMIQANKCYLILKTKNKNQINNSPHQVHQEQIRKRKRLKICNKITLLIKDPP